MLYVYIILGIIIILFFTVVILAVRKYNNEVVSKELEYVSENYEVNDLKETTEEESTKQDNVFQTVKTEEVKETTKVEAPKPIQKPVDNTPPPVIDLKIPEQTDEEITIVDTAIKEETPSESIEIKDNALVTEESGDEIKIVDNSLKVQEEGDAAVVIPDATVSTPEPKSIEVPKDTTDYKNQAFNNSFDGNTTINKDIKISKPKEKDLNKTEIWDMSEVIKEVNSNEKN